MRRAALALLLPASLALGGASAGPQVLPPDAPGAAEMQAYVRTEAYRKLMAQAMARVPASIVPRCPKLVVEDGAVLLQQRIQFAPDHSPAGGSWRHSQPTHGCGADTLVNFLFLAGPDKRVMTVVGLPGTTRTDMAQQRNAHAFALIALNPVANGCGRFETVNTVFGGYGNRTPPVDDPGEAAEFRPWWESWTMLGCGKHYTVPMSFIPNRMGTQIVPGTIEVR